MPKNGPIAFQNLLPNYFTWPINVLQGLVSKKMGLIPFVAAGFALGALLFLTLHANDIWVRCKFASFLLLSRVLFLIAKP